jgi:predicted peptidase
MKERVLSLENHPLQAYLFEPSTEILNPTLLIYLHGAGERGTNLEHVKKLSIPKMINLGHEIPAIVLCPQCPAEFVWNNVVTLLKELIDKVVEEYNVSKDRIVLTGGSMGGFGTWEMALTYRNFFAGIAPIAGGGFSWRCKNLQTTPVYAVHGGSDSVVPPIYSKLMVDATNKSGGNAKLIVLDGKEHNDGIESAYEDLDVIDWLLKQRRTDFSYVPEYLEEYF